MRTLVKIYTEYPFIHKSDKIIYPIRNNEGLIICWKIEDMGSYYDGILVNLNNYKYVGTYEICNSEDWLNARIFSFFNIYNSLS
jgi:hypothetical protein